MSFPFFSCFFFCYGSWTHPFITRLIIHNWQVAASRDSCFIPDLKFHLRMKSSQCTLPSLNPIQCLSIISLEIDLCSLSYSTVKIHMYVDPNFTLIRSDIVINNLFCFLVKIHKFHYVFLNRPHIYRDAHKRFDSISNYIPCDPRRVRRILHSRMRRAFTKGGSV